MEPSSKTTEQKPLPSVPQQPPPSNKIGTFFGYLFRRSSQPGIPVPTPIKDDSHAAPEKPIDKEKQRSKSLRERKPSHNDRIKAQDLWMPKPQSPVTPLQLPRKASTTTPGSTSPIEETSDGSKVKKSPKTSLLQVKAALVEIYKVLPSNNGQPHNGHFIKDSHGLRYIDKKRFTYDENAHKDAIEYMLKNMHDAISMNCTNMQTDNSPPFEVLEIGRRLMSMEISLGIIKKYPELMNLWILSVLKKHYQGLWDDYYIKRSFLKNTQEARNTILSALSTSQKYIVNSIRVQYFSNNPMIESLNRSTINIIYTELDLDRIKNNADLNFLKRILYLDSGVTFCNNGKQMVSFVEFIEHCYEAFNGYLEFVDLILMKDPVKKLKVMEYFLSNPNSIVSNCKIKELLPTVPESVRTLLKEQLFPQGAYIGCMNKLLEGPNTVMETPGKQLLPVMQEFGLHALNVLKRQALEQSEYDSLKKRLLDCKESSEDWDKLAVILTTIAESINKMVHPGMKPIIIHT